MGKVEIKLSEIMGRHRIKQTELAQAGELRLATVNALFHDRSGSVSKETMARVVEGLRRITGHPYTVGDLFEYREE
ncbi:hypothetical protein RDMS_00015 [Deinococcus sp. RL]|uniref:helix-turn-helix domain-containing protein n=1 Tax=Deinococcus sp. RL TaxID=1489678 RepID=UPI0004D539E8|nr:helix-turn-helix transcriptional regulator [Deinococcus sp. RL]KEF35796.1 hypothetical protein RDMS_00015 [Deinococcus sp. RL]